MKNYICINGQKAELTEEQLKALGIELPKANPFERVGKDKIYYCISDRGIVGAAREDLHDIDKKRFDVGNYCTDTSLMQQRALHETLNRLLWRYSMEHDGDKIKWEQGHQVWYVYFDRNDNKIRADYSSYMYRLGTIHFYTKETTENAIKEIVEPFMEAHPDFKW